MTAHNPTRPLLLLGAALLLSVLAVQTPFAQDEDQEKRKPKLSQKDKRLLATEPKVVVHAKPYDEGTRLNCFMHGVEESGQVVTRGAVRDEAGEPNQYLVYVLISDYDTLGVAAVQFGIAFDPEPRSGIDILGWQDCADLEFRNEDWPMAGTGNLMTWDWSRNCQDEEPVVVGFFLIEVYDPDEFRIIPRPVDNVGAIVHCDSDVMVEIPRDNMGKVSFGEGDGVNPWLSTAKN